MKRVGLTGSIGSGKSIVSRIFSLIGVRVYYADAEARKFLLYKEIKDQLSEKFGQKIIGNDKEIDRKKLASFVFHDPQALAYLNSIIHPLVRSDFEKWAELFSKDDYIIHEAAIIYESGFDENFDAIISVSAPEEMRIIRVMERDNLSRDEVVKRMENQWTDDLKVKMADHVIFNDEEHFVIPQVLNIHRQLTVNSRQ